MIYKYKGKTKYAEFNQFDNAFSILDKIRDGKIILTDAKNDQEKIEKDLGEAKKGNYKKKSEEQKNALYNIKMLNKSRKEVINFFDDYYLMVSEAKIRATKGK